MPQNFKALASILVWILWIAGVVMGFSVLILGIARGHLFVVNTAPMPEGLDSYVAWFACALAYGIGAVVVMILRKKME
jgi:hypothetical protein